MHIVLARPEGPGIGGPAPRACRCSSCRSSTSTRRPASWASATASFVTNVEHKMGLKASATCELTFGEHGVPAVGLAARRGARRHRADVPGHRVRPDDGRHQGDRAPCPPATSTRWSTPRSACRAPTSTRMADKTAPRVTITHHPDVRRIADAAEGVRRGPARARTCTRRPGRTGSRRRADGADVATRRARQRPAAADRQGRRLGAGVRDARAVAADLRRLGLPAGLPDRAVRPRREDRLPVRGHHRDPGAGPVLPQDRAGQRARRSGTSSARSQAFLDAPRAATAGSRRSARCWPRRSPTCRACSAR